MALSKQQKEQLVALYSEGAANAPHAFLLGFQGISVPQDTELRQKIRETGGEYLVVKNTLALRAFEGKPLGELKEQFVGPTAVAYSESEPVALAKALTEMAKTVPVLEFKGGLLNGQQVGGEQIKDIANLPSREELVAKLVYLLQSPIARFVRVMGAVPQGFVRVVEQIRLKKEEQG